MSRARSVKLVLLSVVICGVVAGVAVAASSPTVVTGKATKVGQAGATLTGTVKPNGSATAYNISYGPTTAYGLATATRSVGSSATKTVAVRQRVTGLIPGTVYHYRVNALNRAGVSVGADRTFTTKGHPPAAVITGGAVNVGKTTATPTGTINPEGAATSWQVQYGTTTAYGTASFTQTLPAGTAAVPVSVVLTGLAPGTLFHYRVVAAHGPKVYSYGADATFFTEPTKRPKPTLIAHTGHSPDRHPPYHFTTGGHLSGATSIPSPWRCAGNVGVRYYNGRRQVAFVVAPIGPDCHFSAPATFRRLHGRGPVRLRVRADYRGTGYLAPAQRFNRVTAG